MAEVRINAFINAKRDDAFDLISDHERFLSGGAIESCRVVTPGSGHKNGLGCFREVRTTTGVRFIEEITRFDGPERYDYVIRECTLPIAHDGGSVRLIDRSGGTEVDWVTRFLVPVPLLGGAMAQLASMILTTEFNRLVLEAKRMLE